MTIQTHRDDTAAEGAQPAQECPATEDYMPWHDPELRKDPYPFYARAQAEAPLSREANGTYVLVKYDDVMKYGRLPSVLIAPQWENTGGWRVLRHMALGNDEPDHTRLKRLTSTWFTPKRVPEWIKTTAVVADEILDRIGEDGLVDGYELAVEASHRTICAVLQVPEDEMDEVRHASRNAMPALSAVADQPEFEASEKAFDYMRARAGRMIEHSRAHPGDGLLDHLLALQDRGEMSPDEAVATLMFIYIVGHLDVNYLISSGLHLFTQRPEIFDAFRANPEVRDSIVNELVRFDAPEPTVTRKTTEDLIIRGVHIPAGSVLRLGLGAANRDPDVFDNPHEFDFTRPPEQSRSLTFSLGSHSCQGHLLARAEVRTVWERIGARYSRIKLTEPPIIKNTDASRHYYTLPLQLCR